MKRPFGWIVVGIVVLACALFRWGTVSAGSASLACNGSQAHMPGPVKPSKCDKAGQPQINPLLAQIVLPVAATLATYFGAALGLAKKASGGSGTGTGTGGRDGSRSRLPAVLRWGAVVAEDDDVLSLLQTISAFGYLLGLVIAAVYLFRDAGNEGTLDSPFTHIIIKTQGSALAGVIVGVLALALGVQPRLHIAMTSSSVRLLSSSPPRRRCSSYPPPVRAAADCTKQVSIIHARAPSSAI